jgi:hypothetical protein
VALEGDPGDVEERPAALLGACELRQAELRLVWPPAWRQARIKALASTWPT